MQLMSLCRYVSLVLLGGETGMNFLYRRVARGMNSSARTNNAFANPKAGRDVSNRNYDITISKQCENGKHGNCFVLRCVCTCHNGHHASRNDVK